MHKFALFFMLAVTASMIAVLSEPIFAEEMTGDDSMEMTTMEPHIDSPLKQMSMGVDPHQIQCGTGQKLVFKASNWHPACVKESSFQTLSSWGWIANHDPSQDDLTKMMEDHMAKYPKETEQEHQADIKENMDVKADSSSTNSTSADQPAPQSHTVELRESMEMGTQ